MAAYQPEVAVVYQGPKSTATLDLIFFFPPFTFERMCNANAVNSLVATSLVTVV